VATVLDYNERMLKLARELCFKEVNSDDDIRGYKAIYLSLNEPTT